MGFLKMKMVLTSLIAFLALLIIPTFAAHKYERSDLVNVPPISQSGWTVPLTVASNSLPAPGDLTLTVLGVGRGNVTYNCAEDSSDVMPEFVSQQAEIYDVAPLVQFLHSVSNLDDFVIQFLEYDYAQVDNSTFQCIGTTQSTNDTQQCYNIDQLGTIDVVVDKSILGLTPWQNIPWTHATNEGYQVYVVETAGGQSPVNCGGQPATVQIPYAAEFWFYH